MKAILCTLFSVTQAYKSLRIDRQNPGFVRSNAAHADE